MPRPRELAEDAKTVSLRMSPADWDNLETMALSMGLRDRSSLLRLIAQEKIALGQVTRQKAQMLGKYSSASN
ncbi:hypothetical protein [Nodularia sp. UHCC 0506]|uniref:hypothetical protein n=1 Tax=Nodularia sp. UHCC 0506 TaxID=3110243 RepID=UPI002B201AD5|nr:hypothetical protein [Nodularia sp. UHCC 0506]MEA5516212.1 hypothetical protein [Nodularia sp. UHCC 0506]